MGSVGAYKNRKDKVRVDHYDNSDRIYQNCHYSGADIAPSRPYSQREASRFLEKSHERKGLENYPMEDYFQNDRNLPKSRVHNRSQYYEDLSYKDRRYEDEDLGHFSNSALYEDHREKTSFNKRDDYYDKIQLHSSRIPYGDSREKSHGRYSFDDEQYHYKGYDNDKKFEAHNYKNSQHGNFRKDSYYNWNYFPSELRDNDKLRLKYSDHGYKGQESSKAREERVRKFQGYRTYENEYVKLSRERSHDDQRRTDYNSYEKHRPRTQLNMEPPKEGWASSRRRYEWKEGQIAPQRDEELERELFHDENHVNTGINFTKYKDIKVEVKGKSPSPVKRFEEADLHPIMIENIIRANYKEPTPVQSYTIPIVLKGLDLMACAQTGSGKTAAFLIPILSKLFKDPPSLPNDTENVQLISHWSKYNKHQRNGSKASPSVLVLSPTRELAIQIFDECRRFCYESKMRPCVLYGGSNAVQQKDDLAKGCHILIGTPGRLKDFVNRGMVNLAQLKYLVIDEADRLLDMGFEKDLIQILQNCPEPEDRQTLLFSATFPAEIRKLAKDFMRKYLFLAVGKVGGTTENIEQKILYVEESDKRKKLMQILSSIPPCKTLIFLETKRAADTLDDYLYNQGLPCTSIHGDRTQAEREDALIAFRTDVTPIMIATAVAARGLDIKDIMHVINYDLPKTIDEYVHRIGRTARAGNLGTATSFFNRSNEALTSDLIRILKDNNQIIPEFFEDRVEREETKEEDIPHEEEWEIPSVRYGDRVNNYSESNNSSYRKSSRSDWSSISTNRPYGDHINQNSWGDNQNSGSRNWKDNMNTASNRWGYDRNVSDNWISDKNNSSSDWNDTNKDDTKERSWMKTSQNKPDGWGNQREQKDLESSPNDNTRKSDRDDKSNDEKEGRGSGPKTLASMETGWGTPAQSKNGSNDWGPSSISTQYNQLDRSKSGNYSMSESRSPTKDSSSQNYTSYKESNNYLPVTENISSNKKFYDDKDKEIGILANNLKDMQIKDEINHEMYKNNDSSTGWGLSSSTKSIAWG